MGPDIHFDFAYLALLTKAGLKPLSRWEGTLQQGEIDLTNKMGLESAYVNRIFKNGSKKTEYIFSRTHCYLDLYMDRFDGKPVLKNPRETRFEGYLFGFPPCCVEHYIKHGYSPNSLTRKQQQILFHWSCPDCSITPALVPEYEKIYSECLNMLEYGFSNPQNTHRRLKTAGIAALVLLFVAGLCTVQGPSLFAGPPDNNLHWLELDNNVDQDKDFLEDQFEKILGTNPEKGDTDGDGVRDGVQKALEFDKILDSLPHKERSDGPYIVEHMLRGIETCNICKETTNMGYAEIINPLENLSIEVPYISLHHFLKHGSFSYDGNVHGLGRTNPAHLYRVITSDGMSHSSVTKNDTDKDGIRDVDEGLVGSRPDNTDTDGNGIADGHQWGAYYAEKIDALPRTPQTEQVYVTEHHAKGVENCHICGRTFNMGYLEIINPVKKIHLNIPFIGVHYMVCGSFGFHGDANQGFVDIEDLRNVLSADDNLHRLPLLKDADEDGLLDAEENEFETKPNQADSDGDGSLDGMDVGQMLLAKIDVLGTNESALKPYKKEFLMFGMESCDICRKTVNMGFVRITNPLMKDTMDICYMAMHYMEHGSFAYIGDLHFGRIDPVRLDLLLADNPSAMAGHTDKIPEKLKLGQNYPNPFNPGTFLPVYVPGSFKRSVSLDIYNIRGKLVNTIFNGPMAPGNHLLVWDSKTSSGKDVPAGVYLAVLKSGTITIIKKMTLVR